MVLMVLIEQMENLKWLFNAKTDAVKLRGILSEKL